MPDPKPPTDRKTSEPEPLIIRTPIDFRTAALSVVLVLAAILILQSARQVLIPIVLAVIVSYMLSPVVVRLQRIHVPRAVGAAVVLVALAGALGYAGWRLSDNAIRIVESMPEAARRLRQTIRQQRAEDSALQKVQQAATEIEKTAEAATPPRLQGDVQAVQIVEPAFRAADYFWWGSVGLIGLGAELTMILFLAFFLLAAGDLYKRKLVKIAGRGNKQVTVQILDEINEQIERYLLVLAVTSVVVAVATAAALRWLGLREWLIWGLAAGVLNTIPYFGPFIVSGALLVVAYLQFGALPMAAGVAAAAMVITSLEGWLLTPALMGRAASMNPVAVFVGLLFWGWVWGAWGVVLAVPMMMMLKAVCDRIEDLQAVGELLGE